MPSTDGLSWQASTQVAVTSTTNQRPSSDLRLGGSVSYGRGGLFSTANYSNSTGRTNFRELYFEHQFDDHQTRAGTLNYSASNFLLNQQLLGLQWSRSLNTLLNQSDLYSTLVEVELDTGSLVKLVIDGVVYQTERLEAGRQQINTSRLPSGTYELEIHIIDPNAGLRIERQMFSRSMILPPPRVPLYGLSIGSGVDTAANKGSLTTDNELFATGYFTKRLSEIAGAGVEATSYAGANTATLKLVGINNNFRLQLEGIVGSHSAVGGAIRMAYRGERFNLAMDGLQFRSNFDVDAEPALAKLFRSDVSQAGIATGFRKGLYSLNFRASQSTEDIDDEPTDKRRFSARLRRFIRTGSLYNSWVELNYFDDDDTKDVELRFTMRTKERNVKHWVDLAASNDFIGNTEPTLRYTATVDGDQPDNNLEAQELIARARATASRNRATIGASVSYVDQHYDLGVAVDAIDEQQNKLAFQSLLTGSVQLAGNANGFAFGRYRGGDTGVIVEVAGEPIGDNYDILIDGSRQSVGSIGSKQFIGLPSFRTSTIQLVPRSLAFNGFDKDIQPITLYPGNIHHIDVVAENRYLLITSIVNQQQEKLTNALIKIGQERFFIPQDGLVQIEVKPLAILDIDLGDGTTCSVTAPDPDSQDILIQSVPLVCL